MERFRVRGGARLAGTVTVGGAKNSALKLMAAALLAEGETVLHAVPAIADVTYMEQLLARLGCTVRTLEPGTVAIDVPAQVQTEADYGLVRRLRASITVLGPLVTRCGVARVALPGGDHIGSRGLDMHLSGLAAMGAGVHVEHGFVVATAPHGLTGARIELEFPSVGATENLLMAAVRARGTTVIDNVAREPEVVDLGELLQKMGADVEGIGTCTLVVRGVDALRPTDHTTVPDRIVAATYAIGACLTRGAVTVQGGRAEHLSVVLAKLADIGADIEVGAGTFTTTMTGRPRSVDVMTLPYPGFPTDLQSMTVALLSVASGVSMVTENVYDGRFGFCQELARLGANIRTDGHHAVIRGVPRLSGAPVVGTDIRAGAALVLAGLVADGETLVSGAHHVDRGYPDLVGALRGLGADVSREPDDAEP